MKTSDMMTFTNPEFGTIRTFEESDKCFFCGADVAKALGYSRPNEAVARHAKGTLKRRILTNGGEQEMLFVTEGDVYRLIIRSKLPSAERFEQWVFDTVLPSIRKTGGYIAGEEKMSDEELFMQALLIANRKLEQRNADYAKLEQNHKALTAEAEVMRPKAAFADAVASSEDCIPLGDLAKLLKQNGVDIGRTRLFDWLRKNGYLISQYGSSYNTPTQKAMEQKLFRVKESLYYRGSFEHVNRTTTVTGKGQQYFIRKFLGKEDKQ